MIKKADEDVVITRLQLLKQRQGKQHDDSAGQLRNFRAHPAARAALRRFGASDRSEDVALDSVTDEDQDLTDLDKYSGILSDFGTGFGELDPTEEESKAWKAKLELIRRLEERENLLWPESPGFIAPCRSDTEVRRKKFFF
jgi:hypothetical protein